MEKPNLNNMWETWIEIGPKKGLTYTHFQDSIRCKIDPLFEHFKRTKLINWFHFLYHNNPLNVDKGYFHVRFATNKDIKDFRELNLPGFCDVKMTRKITPIGNISGINTELIINEDISEAWRIIGEQSQWVVNFVKSHQGNISTNQIIQFLHYFMNMFGLGMRATIIDERGNMLRF